MKPPGKPAPAARPGSSEALAVGDIAPRFSLPNASGDVSDIGGDAVAGRSVILCFCADASGLEATLEEYRSNRAAVDPAQALVFAVVRALPGPPVGDSPVGLLHDPEGRVGSAYGASVGMMTVVLRPNRHVQLILRDDDRPHAARALAAAAASTDRVPSRMAPHPPVLLLPDVLTPDECRRLITVYQMEGHTFMEPGHEVKEPPHDYKMRIPEYGRRDRIDHWVVNEQTVRFINSRFQRRLIPEIHKCFQYRVSRHERYRIGSYEGERGGELHGHRDNSEPRGAHRRFAVSVNLNAEEFEGGELAFPEFGGHRYSPKTGEALVFSCSLLHEPLHVTKGRRLVLLGFLYGEV